MRNVIVLIGLLIQFLFGCTTALGQNHVQKLPVALSSSITTNTQAVFQNIQEAQAHLDVLIPDFDEENCGSETITSSFKSKISNPSNAVVSQWHSFQNNTSSQEVKVSSTHYSVPFIGFSTPIYITQRVIRI